jgi:hypothetical protein
MVRSFLVFSLVCLLSLGFVSGCSSNKASSSAEAISLSKAMETTQEKGEYLIGQAKAFYNSKDFQGAVDIAQHILKYVDKDSQEAKNLLEKAKEQLKVKAAAALDGMKGAMGLGK